MPPSPAAPAPPGRWCDKKGARVINNSWGGGDFSQTLRDQLASSPALLVFAAGNDGANLDVTNTYPAAYRLPNQVAVAATGRAADGSEVLQSWSSYGPGTVQLAAPGLDIMSTTLDGWYHLMSGTSMACPFVSGASMLGLQAAKRQGVTLTAAALKSALLAAVDLLPSLDGKVSTNVSGEGLGGVAGRRSTHQRRQRRLAHAMHA